MASAKQGYTEETLKQAVQDISEGKLSLRKASLRYGIPKSTLSLYSSGKLKFGTRRGPASVLTQEEEKLVDYAVHMAKIGYGCTKEQILNIVAKIVASDGRPNPFINNRPGRKWWSLFRKRNPRVSLRTPEKLQLARAKCCTPEVLAAWYSELKNFLNEHNLLNKGVQMWNADEAGFPLCATSGKVLSIRGCKNVYSITADTKEQITVLCAVSAAGEVIPPMQIFPGTRFKYNPMLNSVDGAYFGHSPSGWITSELFFGWITNHFSQKVTTRPVVLLVDGHTSHIDLHTSTFCRDNNIHLYCLPPHSSHLTQPLDVSFYKPLKTAWGKACSNYCAQNPGYHVTKHEFSLVFREAWISSVRLSTIVHGFEEAGLCPFNPEKVLTKDKVLPSMQFSDNSATIEEKPKERAVSAYLCSLTAFEDVLGEDKVKKFRERFEEGYDVTSDELYTIWQQMKKLSLVDVLSPASSDVSNPCSSPPNLHSTHTKEPVKKSVLDDILVYPSVPESKKSAKKTSKIPSHMSGEQFVEYLKEKKDDKDRLEEEKKSRQRERERKRHEREEEKKWKEEERKRKQAEREKKKEEKKKMQATTRGCGRRGGQGRGRQQECSNSHQQESSSSASSSCGDSNSDDCLCEMCGTHSDGNWVQCDRCNKWFHYACVDLQEDMSIDDIEWFCTSCY